MASVVAGILHTRCHGDTLNSGLLQSQARYSMVVFPAFMVLARAGALTSISSRACDHVVNPADRVHNVLW